MRDSIRCWSGIALLAGVVGISGCGGFSIILPEPEECFQEDVVGEECYTETRTYEVCDEICEEDFLTGDLICYEDCFLEDVIDVYCEDVIIDSYFVCD